LMLVRDISHGKPTFKLYGVLAMPQAYAVLKIARRLDDIIFARFSSLCIWGPLLSKN